MKRLIFLLTISGLILSAACTKVKNLANINVNIPYNTEVTLPMYEEGFPLPTMGYTATIGPMEIKTNSTQYMAQYNTNPNKILHVKLAQLAIKVLSPESESIDFFDTMRVYMSAPGHEEFLAAYYYGRPQGDSVAMVCNDVNMKEYFLEETITVKLVGNFNRTMEPGTRLGIYSTFNMLANPLY